MPDYGKRSYWDERYGREDEPFDWMCDFKQLKPTLLPLLHETKSKRSSGSNKSKSYDEKILIVGCGNAPFSHDFHTSSGFKNITNIDYCDIVIEQQKKKYPHISKTFRCLDALDMKNSFQDEYFDFVIDKSLIDTTMCYPDGEETTRRLYQELHRVLKPNGGRLITISLHDEDEVKQFGSSENYRFEVNTCKILNVRMQEEENDIRCLCHTLAVFDKLEQDTKLDINGESNEKKSEEIAENQECLPIKFKNALSDDAYHGMVQKILDREQNCEQEIIDLHYDEPYLVSVRSLKEALQTSKFNFSDKEVDYFVQDVVKRDLSWDCNPSM